MSIDSLLIILRVLILLTGAFIGLRWLKQRWSLSLSLQQIILAYLIKVSAGIAYGYIFLKYYHGDDTWYFNHGIEEQFLLLKQSPWQFFSELAPNHFLQLYPQFSTALHMYTGSLEFWMITKPLALLYIFTGGNYYLNILIFNIFSLYGLLLLWRWVQQEGGNQNKFQYFILFLLPSTVFWLSGIRADGYLFTFLIILLYNFKQCLSRPHILTLIYLFLSISAIFILRNYILLLIFPALVTWGLIVKSKQSIFKAIIFVYGITILLFFLSSFCRAPFNLMQIVIEKQLAFLALDGNTRFEMEQLQPSFWSFAIHLPQAVSNGILRPYLWEWRGALQFIAALESFFIIIYIIILVFRSITRLHIKKIPVPFLLMLITGLLLCIFIGYTVPFPGAIVRYKVIGQIFILISLTVLNSVKEKTD